MWKLFRTLFDYRKAYMKQTESSLSKKETFIGGFESVFLISFSDEAPRPNYTQYFEQDDDLALRKDFQQTGNDIREQMKKYGNAQR